MIITNSIYDCYVTEENGCNNLIEDRCLMIGNYREKNYKTIINIDFSKIIECKLSKNSFKVELGLFVKEIKRSSNKKIVININENTNKSYDVNLHHENYQYIINSNCLNKYVYFNITDLVNTLIDKVHTINELIISTDCDIIKFHSSRGKSKPIIKMTENDVIIDNLNFNCSERHNHEEIKGNLEDKDFEVKDLNCIDFNNKTLKSNSFSYDSELSCLKKVYGHFYNLSGNLVLINNTNYVKWDAQGINQELDILKDKLSIRIRSIGLYFISFMLNARSDIFTTMQLTLNGKKVIESEVQISGNEGVSYGQLILNVDEENSLLNLIINSENSILVNVGVAASIIVYNL